MRAPSTLGSFLRAFSHAYVKQLHALARRFLPAPAVHALLLPGAGNGGPRRYRRHDPPHPRPCQAGCRLRIQQVTARLIVRRVKRPGAVNVPDGQGELCTTRRHRAAFTDSPLPLADTERDQRRHAVGQQAIVDIKNGPFVHAPSSHPANAVRLALAALAHNLTRVAGTRPRHPSHRLTCPDHPTRKGPCPVTRNDHLGIKPVDPGSALQRRTTLGPCWTCRHSVDYCHTWFSMNAKRRALLAS